MTQQMLTADHSTAAKILLVRQPPCWNSTTRPAWLCSCSPLAGPWTAPVPTDPTIYRFYEIVQVYGPTIKELIDEEFGDGIMSAINFRFDISRVPDPAGGRVVVTLDGKFLPCQR